MNAQFQTEVPNIYAAGDVIGFPALASTSMEQARVAMCHACDKHSRQRSLTCYPPGFIPSLKSAQLGRPKNHSRPKVSSMWWGEPVTIKMRAVRSSVTSTGFLKLLFNCSDMKLLGVHVIGEQASELAHIGLMAMLTGNGVELFNQVCFNYPTLGELYKYAAYDAMLKQRDLTLDGR